MSRAKDLEDAVRKYHDAKGHKYMSSKNQTVKCWKCKAFQQVRTQGFDFLVWFPFVRFEECKTGTGTLTKPQKKCKTEAEAVGIPYLVIHDTIDALLKADK